MTTVRWLAEIKSGRQPMATLTEALLQLLCTRQRHKEDVLEYIKRFKQGWQIMRSHMGDAFPHHSIQKTAEYKELLNTDSEAMTDTASARARARATARAKQVQMKNGAMERWQA